jgi:hypothetical protein
MIVDQMKGVDNMKMITASICNKQIMKLNLVPYDQKYFEVAEKQNRVVTCHENMVECIIDVYGLVDNIVDMTIKTDSFTVALMTIFNLIGENGITNF